MIPSHSKGYMEFMVNVISSQSLAKKVVSKTRFLIIYSLTDIIYSSINIKHTFQGITQVLKQFVALKLFNMKKFFIRSFLIFCIFYKISLLLSRKYAYLKGNKRHVRSISFQYPRMNKTFIKFQDSLYISEQGFSQHCN